MQVDHVESFTKNTNVHVNPIINMRTAQRHKTYTTDLDYNSNSQHHKHQHAV